MDIKSAEFILSSPEVDKCPEPKLPEYAFIGRSNVGKSSLINMLTGNKKLAKISSTPGKTQLINHFLINEDWCLVDYLAMVMLNHQKKNVKNGER
jgi:GTP-binding protein